MIIASNYRVERDYDADIFYAYVGRLENYLNVSELYSIRNIKLHDFSVFGNPLKMNSEKNRNDVCDKYESIWPNIAKQFSSYVDALYEKYMEGIDIKLVCFCKPKRCHADTIVRYIENKCGKTIFSNYIPKFTTKIIDWEM